jgi:hypothetical protein
MECGTHVGTGSRYPGIILPQPEADYLHLSPRLRVCWLESVALEAAL